MRRRNWKRVHPNSMAEAIRLCTDYAQEKHNRSVARVAELIGVSEWAIYKWMSEGSIPSQRIRPFEFACDATFITQYIGHSARKLVIDIPTGKKAGEADLLQLNEHLQDAVRLLTQFYQGEADEEAVLAGVGNAMGDLAGHRENVAKANSPELPMFGDEG